MKDSHGRTIDYLRISLTDRCNFRCIYCMPEDGVQSLAHEDILRIEEIEQAVRVAAGMGIRSIRLTGGEPLVRLGVVDLLRAIAHTPGIENVSMTTNGAPRPFAASAGTDGRQAVGTPQPPIWDIPRSVPTLSWCSSGLAPRACANTVRAACSSPERSAVRRSYSSSENKHGRSLPSAVRRRRLHSLQKWRDSGLMKPTVPCAFGNWK